MQKLDSSWRENSPEITLEVAKSVAPELGITRVANVTWLDRIGIPVYSSIRPTALKSSLCVNAGKGLRQVDAQVGAYMEAIEFAWSEPHRACVLRKVATPQKVSEQDGFNSQFVSLCPVLGVSIDPDQEIEVVDATELATGITVELPSELVLSPIEDLQGRTIFGTSTNGLSSGNSAQEAILHGLCELIERDVQSFYFFNDVSRWVSLDNAPPELGALRQCINDAGMELALRYSKNEFGLPFMQAYILAEKSDKIRVSHGVGLHLSAKVAAVRAITEAAQSRLSYIHGGRDDLTVREQFFERCGAGAEELATERLISKVYSRNNSVEFGVVPSLDAPDIKSALIFLREKLSSRGLDQVFVVRLSSASFPLTVMKTIVPGLEFFSPRLKRFGPRLRNFLRDG